MKDKPPLLEYDPPGDEIITTRETVKPLPDMPKRCLICFMSDMLEAEASAGHLEAIGSLYSEMTPLPIYLHRISGCAVVHPGITAPLAAAMLEELIGHGADTFIACGGAGVLDSSIAVGTLILPTRALRDEGTSYHYLPAGEPAVPDADMINWLKSYLATEKIKYLKGPVWTTDGIYRESRARIARRREAGCLAVEMEAAALFAAAKVRGVRLAAMLYAGDDISGRKWRHRNWQKQKSVRQTLFNTALQALCGIPAD